MMLASKSDLKEHARLPLIQEKNLPMHWINESGFEPFQILKFKEAFAIESVRLFPSISHMNLFCFSRILLELIVLLIINQC